MVQLAFQKDLGTVLKLHNSCITCGVLRTSSFNDRGAINPVNFNGTSTHTGETRCTRVYLRSACAEMSSATPQTGCEHQNNCSEVYVIVLDLFNPVSGSPGGIYSPGKVFHCNTTGFSVQFVSVLHARCSNSLHVLLLISFNPRIHAV